jgi:hypothetical protein
LCGEAGAQCIFVSEVLVKLISHFNPKEPMTNRVMPLGLQKYTITRIFKRLNPKNDPEDLDWDGLDDKCCLGGNLENMQELNPQYIWVDEDIIIRKYEDLEHRRLVQEKLGEYQSLLTAGLDEEAEKVSKEIDEIEARFNKKYDTGWHVEQTEDDEMHTIEIEIKPRPVFRNGKKYPYGRIQLNVDPAWVGLKAKISVFRAKER